VALLAVVASGVFARTPGTPIRLAWEEGDIAGVTAILAPGSRRAVGYIEFHQRRQDDLLSTDRVARFDDGSSDEDHAEARVAAGPTLEALSGRSIIRDAGGRVVVDLTIDVSGGRLTGFTADGTAQTPFDQRVSLPSGTYWGPLIFLVLKNFDANAENGALTFRTVAPTPQPRVLDLEVRRDGDATVAMPGGSVDATRYTLRPSVHWAIDPFVRLVAPSTEFFVLPGAPPALARFVGPRNYAGQEIEVE
jgi:hypothetical protein